MNRISRILLLLGVAAVLAVPIRAQGQDSYDVTAGGRTEWVVEKMVGFGVIDDRMFTIRPWSRGEILRLLDEARNNLERLNPEDRREAERILDMVSMDRLRSSYHVTLREDATALDSPWLPVPEDTGADRIDAEVNHLVRYQDGREYVDGQTIGTELDVSARLSKFASLTARPRFWVATGRKDSTKVKIQLLEGGVGFRAKGVRMHVGRERSVWGPGREGGGLLSTNVHGMDRISVSSESPFRWPGFLSLLGPSMVELFVARLESVRDIPHSNLVGYALSIRPHKLLEASASALIQSGGEGAPETSFGDRLADHLLFIDWLFNSNPQFLSSNKAATVSLRLRVPSLRNTQIFAQHTMEDPALNVERMFWQDAAWLVGFWIPRLDHSGRFDLRGEFHHGGVRLHRHAQFTSGRTLDEKMIGMGGPDTNGGLVEITASGRSARLSLELGVENRSEDRWTALVGSDGGIDVWEKVEDRPDELSFRSVMTVTGYSRRGRLLRLRLGLERVTNSSFVDGATRSNTLVQVSAVLPIRSSVP